MKQHKSKIIWSSVVLTLFVVVLVGFINLGGSEQVTDKKIRIGYTHHDILVGLKNMEVIEGRVAPEGYSVEWIEFQDEVKIYQALEEGTIDFGKVGDAVPSFLHKGKNAPVFVAAEPPSPNGRAIATRKGAEMTGVEDLVGKKVAYTPFTNDHYFLLQLLEKSSLGVGGIDKLEAIEASPSEGVELLQNGEVEAVVVSEPYVSLFDHLEYPLVYDGELTANQDVYLTTQENIKERKDIINELLSVIFDYEDLLNEDIHGFAEILYQKTKIPHIVWLNVFVNEAYGVSPLYEGMVKQQQERVDFLFEQKVISQNFDVNEFAIDTTEQE